MSVYADAVAAFRRELLTRVLAEHGGNRARAARALGLQRTYLCRLLRAQGIAAPIRYHWRRAA